MEQASDVDEYPARGVGRVLRQPRGPVRFGQYGRGVRLIVCRCEVTYTGRLTAYLPPATRLVMIKADGTVMVWSDGGGYKVSPSTG